MKVKTKELNELETMRLEVLGFNVEEQEGECQSIIVPEGWNVEKVGPFLTKIEDRTKTITVFSYYRTASDNVYDDMLAYETWYNPNNRVEFKIDYMEKMYGNFSKDALSIRIPMYAAVDGFGNPLMYATNPKVVERFWELAIPDYDFVNKYVEKEIALTESNWMSIARILDLEFDNPFVAWCIYEQEIFHDGKYVCVAARRDFDKEKALQIIG